MDSSFDAQNFCNNPLVTPTECVTAEGLNMLPADGSWGVDKAVCLVPINSEHIQLQDNFWTQCPWWSGRRQELIDSFKSSFYVGHAKVDVKLTPDFNLCTVAFNPSLVVAKKSGQLLEPSKLSEVIRTVLDQMQPHFYAYFDDFDPNTGELVHLPNWEQYVRFKRLDFARNLYIEDLSYLPSIKTAIENATPKYGRYKSKYGSRDGGWTLYNGTSGSGVDRIYDKHIELKRHKNADGVPEGTFRFETQLMAGRLNAPIKVKTLDHISNESVWKALEHRWRICGWGVPISEPNTVFKATEHLSEAVQSKLIGDLYKLEHGYTSRMNSRQKAAVIKLAKSCGIVPGSPLNEIGVPKAKLDLFTGRVIPW